MQIVELQAFDEKFSQQYLEQKQRLLHINIESELKEKLLLLSDGKPILLDLAVKWLSHDLPSDWMSQKSLDQLQALSEKEMAQHKKHFEIDLVGHIQQIRDQIDRLTLIMSRVYPLEEAMIPKLLRLSEEEAKALFEEAQIYVFVKSLPDGRITLHDEMRRMVNEYVWPEVDRQGRRRRRDSKIAAELFEQQDRKLREKLKEVSTSDVIKREDLAIRREVIDQQWIEHALYSDPTSGFDVWKKIIDERRAANDFRFAKRLLDMAEPYIQKFDSNQKFETNILSARLANDIGEVHKAENILNELLVDNLGDKEREADIYNALGLVEEKLGKLRKALGHQQKCYDIVKETNKNAVPFVANRIGYIHRLLGQLQEAQKFYQLSLESQLSFKKEERNMHLVASALNNLGNTYGLQGEYDQMEFHCLQALKIWQQIGSSSGIGVAENTIAIFFRDRGDYSEAIELIERAIGRYEIPNDHKELCQAYFNLGWTQLYQAEKVDKQVSDISQLSWNKDLLSQSKKSIEKSRAIAEKYGLGALLPGILHIDALTYWYQGRIDQNSKLLEKARELNTASYEISEQSGDIRYAISSLLADAEWDYEIGEYDNIPSYVQRLEGYQRKGSPYPLHFGRMPRIEADIAFSKGNFETAFAKYTEALVLIHQHGGFGRYSIERELLRLGNKIQQNMSSTQIEKWINYLLKKWRKKDGQDTELLTTWCDQQLLHAKLRSIEW